MIACTSPCYFSRSSPQTTTIGNTLQYVANSATRTHTRRHSGRGGTKSVSVWDRLTTTHYSRRGGGGETRGEGGQGGGDHPSVDGSFPPPLLSTLLYDDIRRSGHRWASQRRRGRRIGRKRARLWFWSSIFFKTKTHFVTSQSSRDPHYIHYSLAPTFSRPIDWEPLAGLLWSTHSPARTSSSSLMSPWMS